MRGIASTLSVTPVFSVSAGTPHPAAVATESLSPIDSGWRVILCRSGNDSPDGVQVFLDRRANDYPERVFLDRRANDYPERVFLCRRANDCRELATGKVMGAGLLPAGGFPPPAGGRDGGMRGGWVGNADERGVGRTPRKASSYAPPGGG
jgi:hypothetical protein